MILESTPQPTSDLVDSKQTDQRYISRPFNSTDTFLQTRDIDRSVSFVGQSDHSIEYWRKRLASCTPTIFPFRPYALSGSSVLRRFHVAHENLTRDHGITPLTLVNLAYALVLSAHSGSSDEVVFGNVHPSQSVDMIGSCKTVLPHNVTFCWDTMTLDFLHDLQSDLVQIDDHSGVALREIPVTGITNLFRTILDFYPNDKRTSDVDHDISFLVKTIGFEFIEVEAQFVLAYISEPEIKIFMDHFNTALKSILQNLTGPLRDVNLVSPEEKQRIIVEMNPMYSPGISLSSVNNVTELIEQQVRKTPQRIALQFCQEQFVSYHQMDSFANNLALTLIAHNIQRGELVGIYMDKSCEMFISILAIHKAGGGYVPLAPAHPPERIQTILGLAEIKIVLTRKLLQSQFNSYTSSSDIASLVVDIHELLPSGKPDVAIGRDDISHVLFTSGSTGLPKGVVLTHGSIIESVVGSHAVIGCGDDRVLQLSDYTFDASVWDWGVTLTSGGTLCIAPTQELMDNLGIIAHRFDVTFLGITPTVAALIEPTEIPSLQMMAVGGESLTPEVRNKWANAVTLVNAYGPTEANTNVLALTGVTSSTECSNVGYPFGLNAIYVLDQRLRPVPLGCTGEIFIGGPQLARGYLKNPEQTAKVFIDDPFRPGNAMYATGDLGRMSPVDGSVTYLGRRDTQIKIRGFRVETGEIEVVLKAASKFILNAVVLKINIGHDILVAFLEYPSGLSSPNADLNIIHDETVESMLSVLRLAVRQKLPSYMAPGSYVVLNRFPLTLSRKVDRKALADFFHAHEREIREHRTDSELFPQLSPSESQASPSNEVRARLRSLWATTLNLSEGSLSVDDDFYMMGGDSISAIRLASAAREEGIHLLATDIIQNSTIRTMTHIAECAVVNHGFDGDDVPSVEFEQMSPSDLTLMELDQKGLDVLRDHLLPKHGLLPSDVLDVYPCTALQNSFFLAGQLIDRAYIVTQAYDLPPGTSGMRIRQAFDDFISHPNGAVLRTVFVFDPPTDRVLQVVMRPGWKRMQWTTAGVVDEVDLDIAITKYQEGPGSQKFEDGCLLTRGCIFELNGVPKVLSWSLHHGLADHWTINNAECDIGDVYARRPLPPRRSFKPMIKFLEHLDRTPGLDFWRSHLLNATPTPFLLPLPGAPRAIVNAAISRELQTGYELLTRQFGITPSSLVTAAWSIVLSAHTGSTDVVFGQVVAGRNAPIKNIDSMAGNTINTVARRVILKPDATILHTLREIQSEQIEVSKHEHISLADIISQGIPVSSLFRSILNYTNLPGDQRSFAKSFNEHLLWNRRFDSLDGQDLPFTLSVTPFSTGYFSVLVNYTREVISQAEVDVILDHFEAALLFLAHHPHNTVSDVNLLSPDETKRLLYDRNPPDPLDDSLLCPAQSVCELIEGQVQKTPKRIALQFGQDIFLTYQEMDAFSNFLAHALLSSGLKRGHLVGIYMDKSVEMFISIIGIHKSGAAFVPLDPEYPSERIQTILGLAESKIVLVSKELQSQFDQAVLGCGVESVLVDIHGLSLAHKPDVGRIERNDISHVLFTSGSTGTPKGILTTHGCVTESILSSRELYGLRDDRVLQFSNYTFDFSIWDWCGTLSAGGTLCVVPKRELMNDLGRVANAFDITFLEVTPTVAALITPKEIPTLQQLVVGGELLMPEVRDTWADYVNLVNVYGPTETTVAVIAKNHISSSTDGSNIGHPLRLCVTYVLDNRLRPVPLGCVGELFLGGPQLAQGYLGNAEQTAKVFVDDPFRPGTTMYATGDLVRINPVDLSFTYLDRRDTQIKISGLRVEAGEIEAVLKATSKVITNTAVMKVDIGREALVAFLEYASDVATANDVMTVRDDSVGPLLASLRYAVRRTLPSFMAPTIYVTLNRFPLTFSGKLDRNALRTYFYSHENEIRTIEATTNNFHAIGDDADPRVTPQTELQGTIRSLWASVLCIDEGSLGMEDDFYSVGGDSISAIRLARAARAIGLQLPVVDIIRNPTISAMARIAGSPLLEDGDDDDDDTPSMNLAEMAPHELTLLDVGDEGLSRLKDELLDKHGLTSSDVLDIYPSTALQSSFLVAGLLIDSAYIVSATYDLPHGTNRSRLWEAFEDFMNHPNGMMLRTMFHFDARSDRWLQVLVRSGAKRMEWASVIVADESELDRRIEEYSHDHAMQEFKNGELLTRACIFELDGYARALVWSLHHALMDHWAMKNYICDIEDTYAHRPLPPRRPFKPMMKYLERLDRKPGLDYWRSHLQDVSPTPFLQSLPSSRRVVTNKMATRDVLVGHGSLTRQFGIMASTLVTCAWSMVLAAHSNCTDVVFGQVLAGRSAPIRDLGALTGVTINTIARRVTLKSEVTVLETLRHIQLDQIEISKHEHITLADLLSEGIPVSSLFKSFLNFRNVLGDQTIIANDSTEEHLFGHPRGGAIAGIDFPFGVDVTPRSTNGFLMAIIYSNEVISEPEVNVILDHIEAALLFLVNHPHDTVGDVHLVNEIERQRLVGDMPSGDRFSYAQNMSELIEGQVARTPKKIALQFGQDVFLTYREMDCLSNDISRTLIVRGVRRGTLVALYMDKSIEMFLSILAIHKAGGGYVPLDPDHPVERTQTILRLAQAMMVLTTRDLQGQLHSVVLDTGVMSMLVDFNQLVPSIKPDVGPIGRDDICHVLFTSGSTGTPKGVVLTHGSVIESAVGSLEVVGRIDGRVLQFANYTFDASVWDWSVTLSDGGTLCIVPKQQLMEDLANVAQSMDITFLQLTPTVAALIRPEEIPSLQILAVGGEMLTPEVRNMWADAVTLVNGYGPTEASTNVLVVTRVTSSTECSNIGYPFGLNIVYVLDERLRPTPFGCVGELFITGPQVARGYLHDTEQTSKVFVENPFHPGSVMYATGDLVRMSPSDGSITLLGRRDSQIKIRGLRVEVEEIETVLKATADAITNAAVLKLNVEREMLVAFLECPSNATAEGDVIVHDDGVGRLLASLRYAVRRKLPSYMAPTIYVPLNRFPVTSSGKLDRNALRTYFHSHENEIRTIESAMNNFHAIRDDADPRVIPQTDLQGTIRSLWASVLRIDECSLGMEDDFYSVGGDSISAIHLARAARVAGLHLPVIDIIRHPTIRAMERIAGSFVLDDDDDDDITPMNLAEMTPHDLTLLDIDDAGLDRLKDELLKKYGLPPRDVLDVYPSTALQTSFLVAGLLIDSAYIVSTSYDLPPATDSTRVREAFEHFMNHPNGMMLRTIFHFDETSDRWLQVLVRPGARRMEWATVSVPDEAELDRLIGEYSHNRSIQPYKNGELLTRACIFELDGYARALVWSVHHALSDHWSLNYYMSDIEDTYAHRPLPLRRPFKPMITYLERLDRKPGLDYWRSHLQNVSPTPFLQSLPSSRRAFTNKSVARDVLIGHASFTRQFSIMASTLVTGAWSMVLAAHSGCTDVVFGQVLAGRNAPIRDLASLTGVTINTIARRVTLNSDITVLETLRQIQLDQIEISKHEHITLVDLLSAGIPVSGLFKSLLNFRNTSREQTQPPCSSTENHLFRHPRSDAIDDIDFPFGINVAPHSINGFSIQIVYSNEVISEPEVNVILDHLETAILFLTDHPHDTVGDVDLVNENERQRLVGSIPLRDLSSSAQNISELIEAQVARTPEKIALQFGQDVFLTYREMDCLSNDISRTLIVRGVRRGTLVALYMDKSIEMFLSILAIHKAGGGYVPLDPDHPVERTQTILRLAQAMMVLTTRDLQGQLHSVVLDTGVMSMLVDFNQLVPSIKPDVGPIGRDDICHVLFTSGSTGTPKGVVLTHGSVIESAVGSLEVVGRIDGRVLQFANYTFDSSVWDWSVTLTNGGTLCIVLKQQLMEDLSVVGENFDITFVQLTPTVAALIRPEEIPSLQILIVGGETLTPEVRNTWADAITLVNGYGPTEASTYVLMLTRVTLSTLCSNVGYPFGLNTVYVLDERLRPTPLGCVGELFITGPQVARGYLNDPEQTSKVFVSNPFRPGSVMYATGDLVRMNPSDGSINFLGRRDSQIKIRGLRVEVEEIEAVLKATAESVTNAAVLKIDIGRELLVAFLESPSDATAEDTMIIVHDDGVRPLIASLRYAVRRRLPSYMAPAIYVPLNRFPLTTSGKLDRKALDEYFYMHEGAIRDLERDADGGILAYPDVIDPRAIPQTELQATIRSIWASVLRIDEGLIGMEDDFYTVGGDSISAIYLARAARATGFHLPVIDIIRNPTIRAMAQIADSSVLDEDEDEDDTPNLAEMTPHDLTWLDIDDTRLNRLKDELLNEHGLSPSDVLDIYPSTALQTSFLVAGLLIDNAYIVSATYDLPPATDSTRLREAFENFINHPNGMMLRTMFQFDETSDRWLQVLVRPGAKRMEWATVVATDESELDRRVDEYSHNRAIQQFKSGELLTRACIFELGGRTRALVWSLHHALTDHWAMKYYMSDIKDTYAHRPLPFRRPFKPMIKYLERLDRKPGLDYWRSHLQDVSPTPFLQSLPSSRRVVTNKMATRDVLVGHGSLTRQFGIMASTLVTCAWSMVLAAHSNCTDVVFGQVLAGRSAPIRDLGALTGVTINTIARRVTLKSEVTVLETLRHIQLDQIEISKHEHITLADLLSEGIPVSSLFKSFLNFRNVLGDQTIIANGSTGDLFSHQRGGAIAGIDFPFGVDVTPRSTNGFSIEIVYSNEVISEPEVIVILDHLEAALLFLANHPHDTVGDVNLVNEIERQRLVGDMPSGDRFSYAQNMSELIEGQVARTPKKIALQFGQDVFLTYREMDCLSNDISRTLIVRGVRRGTLVALYMDKSIEMFLSILAIHKAGGGYVPLDPDHPVERTQTILRLAQAVMVLTSRDLRGQLDSTLSDTGVMHMLIDFKQLSLSTKPDVGPLCRDDVCHVLFTSGSTGTPKGVVLTHGSIIESALGSRDLFGPLVARVLPFSNYTFDVSVWDWSTTLISGGTLCIVPKQQLMDNLGMVVESLDATFLETTPTVAALMKPEENHSLQTLVVGGEMLTPEVRNRWADTVNLLNVYGPTEASTNVLAFKPVTSSTGCSNIGYPFGLNTVYVLDERLRPTPLGCVGELFITGPQVARGYLNDPEQTSKVFVSNPFRPGSVMYATGDLVRMNPSDGSINFLDRRDSQIKIRGLRVEVEEIETVLKATADAITNAAVLKLDIGHEMLVALLECSSDTTAEDEMMIVHDDGVGSLIASLRYAVRRKLPSYMAPTIYVPLNRFPLTSSGKLDRNALRTYFYSHEHEIRTIESAMNNFHDIRDDADPRFTPQTELQGTIRSLWASVLRIDEGSLGMEDDFYSVGGDSISAIYLARAARVAGLHLPVIDIIRNPTIRAMEKIAGSVLDDGDDDDDDTMSMNLAEMTPHGLTLLDVDDAGLIRLKDELLNRHGLSASDVLDVYPSTALQTSFLVAGLLIDTAYIVSASYDLPPGTDSTRVREAFENFINHPNGMMLRTIFHFDATSGRWFQVLVRPGARRMEWATVIVADATKVDQLVDEYLHGRGIQPFRNGDLLTRGCIFELDGYARVFVWSLHHALTDHWAMNNYKSDIEDIYAHRCLPPRRPFKPMITYLERLDRKPGLDYWRSHLQYVSPTPFPQSLPSSRRVITNRRVSRDVLVGHGSLTRQFGIMASTLVTAAWSIVLAAHSGCTDVVFGQILAGRNAPIRDLGSMTGVTINTVARRVILNLGVTVLEALRRVQLDQIEISKHENITFSDLLAEGIPVFGLFKSLLNFRNVFDDQRLSDSSACDHLFNRPRSDSRDDFELPLGIAVVPLSTHGFSLTAVYIPEVLSKTDADLILDDLGSALVFLATHSHDPIGDFNLLNRDDR